MIHCIYSQQQLLQNLKLKIGCRKINLTTIDKEINKSKNR
jgi:hypothetical protein